MDVKWIKAISIGDAVINQVGEAQRSWLLANMDYAEEYIKTENAREILLMYLQEFADFVIKKKAG